ncbi:MAG: hypothetical protein ACI9D4_001184 [Polaribacter sp.]|jgi:hypothetical protein|uniref:DUF6515 family protein n=1 Tax=Candidatus Marifrigoribacter sp. Uisw_064 TaxID=3230970 RepID=UPI003AE8F37B
MKKSILIRILCFSFLFNSCATRGVTSIPSSNVVIIKKAPRTHKVVRVNGNRYYVWNGKYHRKTKKGYVLVYR